MKGRLGYPGLLSYVHTMIIIKDIHTFLDAQGFEGEELNDKEYVAEKISHYSEEFLDDNNQLDEEQCLLFATIYLEIKNK
jgi:hypothetical protein